ncbi:MAG: pyridoxal kinase [Propionibacteriales bacterium]|nr:MAG: pyridoxal kinase [Propionibacteriales bacterium]
MTTVLSIQSAVAYGHVGNSAATFPLMRRGVEVIDVLTVNFSNHTGYGAWRGPLIPAADVAEVIAGVADRGVLGSVDAVLSGYLGAADVGEVILDAVASVRELNPKAIYLCDPVMGDVGRGFYARPGIPEFMRDEVLQHADVITPNQFELEFLAGTETKTLDDVLSAADMLRAKGPSVVLVTSVAGVGGPNTLTMVGVSDTGAWQVQTPYLDRTFTGSGDLTSAMFLAQLLETDDLARAIENTANIVYSVLAETTRIESAELALVKAGDLIVEPAASFTATQIR